MTPNSMISGAASERAAAPIGNAQRFRLLPFFAATSLAMFLLVAGALWYFEKEQGVFFQEVQQSQINFFKQVQDDFATHQDSAARRDLLSIHEAGNVNLTRLFANALWEKDFAPYVAKAAQISADGCRAIADVKDEKDGKMKPPAEKKACFADIGKKIAAFPEFAALNAKVFEMMKKSTVFKIKVFDLRGITVYSSEHAQMGEDKSQNAGWKGAVDGKPTSELTFRDKFSAFEGVVEKRDLISSYLPVLAPGSEKVVGVFEVYSDVTPFLNQIKATSAGIRKAAADNQGKVEVTAAGNLEKVEATATRTLAIVMLLLVLLFGALSAIVWRAAGIIARQEKEHDRAQLQLAQSEKMASLGQMVAGVAHEINNPIGFVSSNLGTLGNYSQQLLNLASAYEKAETLLDPASEARLALAAAKRAAELDYIKDDLIPLIDETRDGLRRVSKIVQDLKTFAHMGDIEWGWSNLHDGIDSTLNVAWGELKHKADIEKHYGDLPAVYCVPSELNQVFMNILVNAAHAIDGKGTISITTARDGADHITIAITDTGKGIATENLNKIFDPFFTTKPVGTGTGLGLYLSFNIVKKHQGEILVASEPDRGTTFTIRLPIRPAENEEAPAA